MKEKRVIKEGAIFVADVHINENRDEFFEFLQKVEKLNPPQLFLMGDIFDLLVGGVNYSVKFNKKYIDFLNKLSNRIEIYYFEGNHDFLLSSIFPNITVFPIQKQPVQFFLHDKSVLLSHGDVFVGLQYKIYTSLIRSYALVKLISFFDSIFGNILTKKIINSQKNKNLCKKITNFNDIIVSRMKKMENYNFQIVLEGHFHQDAIYELDKKKYINLPSFACNKSFFIVQSQEGLKKMQF